MTHPIRTVALATLLGATLLTRAAAASPQELIAEMLPPETVLPHADAIGLAPAEREALKREIAELQARMAPLQQRMREETGQLAKLLAAPKPDEAAVFALYEKLNATENELKRVRVTMTLRVKARLTAEQQEKVRGLKAKAGASSVDGTSAPPGVVAKLQRVRDGLERWKQEGRDVTRVRALWEQFQQAAEKRWHQQAQRALDEALAILDGTASPLAATPAPAR